MNKPKDIAELASRLATAATTPLVSPAPVLTAVPDLTQNAPIERPIASAPKSTTKRKPAKRATMSLFLRLSKDLYEQYDHEAIRRTKATGRGVSVQQIIIEKLAGAGV